VNIILKNNYILIVKYIAIETKQTEATFIVLTVSQFY